MDVELIAEKVDQAKRRLECFRLVDLAIDIEADYEAGNLTITVERANEF